MRRLINLIFISIGFFASLGFYLYIKMQTWSEVQIEVPGVQLVEFPRGTPLSELSKKLEKAGIVNSSTVFSSWVKYFSKYNKFQAGQYKFEGKYSPRQVAEKIINGDIFVPIVFEYTIPEGYNYNQIARRLSENKIGNHEAYQELLNSKDFLFKNRIPMLEGFLYPATYRFSKMPSPEEALSEAVKTFWEKLPRNYEDNIGKLGLTLIDAVIFASLIELETFREDEKPKVSEVIWRRLKQKIPLGIDAAIIYGIPDYSGNLTRKHLEDASNRYNSRIHVGLPPTPICSPSVTSLQAVLNPTNEGYMYYVLDPLAGEGAHHFSKTLDEHNLYVKRLVSRG